MENDAISRSALFAMMDKCIDMAQDDEMHHAMCAVAEGIKEAPALDVAPVVRCKDCKHRRTDRCPMRLSEIAYSDHGTRGYSVYTQEKDKTIDNGFCHLGARKDGEAE